MSSSYSGTSLEKKLGIKELMVFGLSREPSFYFDLFSNWPKSAVKSDMLTNESCDFIHIFCQDLEMLSSSYSMYKPCLKKSGMMWISWPKKASKIRTDIDGNKVRDFILNNGLVDVKVASIDKTWSALKAVYRLSDR